ncbi:MAG: hypothetical protein M3Y44_12300 [Actinomycetota bacterium]|nr:hypothetical protein [Actinomycetota bacterium]
MSITKDIRSYADTAVEQGKQALDQAQTQLQGVTGQANGLVGKVTGTAKDNVFELTAKATGAAHGLRTQAEKAVNVEAIKAAVEPYVAQAKGYSTSVTDRAEELFSAVKHDQRVARLVGTAESVTGIVVETVQERVVRPVQSRTGRGTKPVVVTAPAASKPVATKSAAKPAATKPAATATAGKRARKAPAKRAAAKS